MRLIDLLPDNYKNCTQIIELQEALEQWTEDLWAGKEDFFQQLNIDSATWGLDLWDRIAGTKTQQLDIDERKNVIKAKITGRPPCTKNTILSIVKNFAYDSEIIEHCSEYSFDVIIKTKKTQSYLDKKIVYLINQLEDIKPAHMGYKIIIDYLATLLIQVRFIKYLSGTFKYCGTLNITDASFISTEGRKYTESSIEKINKYFSDVILRADINLYSERSFGRSLGEKIKDTKQAYYSAIFLRCSPNTYCKGGV